MPHVFEQPDHEPQFVAVMVQLFCSVSDSPKFPGLYAQVLDLVWTPEPQVTEQLDHDPQSLKSISVKKGPPDTISHLRPSLIVILAFTAPFVVCFMLKPKIRIAS